IVVEFSRREDLTRRSSTRRVAAENSAFEFPPANSPFNNELSVILQSNGNSLRQLAGRFCFADPNGRAEIRRLHENRKIKWNRVDVGVKLITFNNDVLNHRQTRFYAKALHDRFIH